MYKLADILHYQLTTKWKLLLVTALAGFIMSSASHVGLKALGLKNPTLANPSAITQDPLENILPKLEQIPNSFKLKSETVFVREVSAANDFDQANGYVVVDLDSGKILASKNSNESLPIASLTKVMTAVVALDLASQSETFQISEHASKMIPTKIGVVPGEKMTLNELINALILTSANDAAQVIKEGIDQKYDKEIFIQSMNAKAKFLKLSKTNFENPQGFDSINHYSSPEDLAVLTQYALKNYPLIAEVSQKDYEYLPEDQNHKLFDLYNWNGLLGVYPGAFGVKIGNTDDAGKTTIVAAKRDGKSLAVVLLGAPGVLERDLWASQLLDLGFESEFGLTPVEITEDQLKEKYATWKYFN